MPEFALFRDGVFELVASHHADRPEDVPRKGVAWYPVGVPVEGTPAGWAVVGDEAIETIQPAPPSPPRREGTFREFMDLFSEAEQQSIAGAAMANVAVKLWYDRAMGGSIRLDHSDTAAGLAALVGAGIIAQAVADRVLATDYDNPVA